MKNKTKPDPEREQDIRQAQIVWTEMNRCLHRLGPLPDEVVNGWDRVKPWLNKEANKLTNPAWRCECCGDLLGPDEILEKTTHDFAGQEVKHLVTLCCSAFVVDGLGNYMEVE